LTPAQYNTHLDTNNVQKGWKHVGSYKTVDNTSFHTLSQVTVILHRLDAKINAIVPSWALLHHVPADHAHTGIAAQLINIHDICATVNLWP